MNLNLPEKEKVNKKRISINIILIVICIFATIVAIGTLILGDDVVDNIFGINKLVKRTEQEETELKSNFENIFNNELINKQNYDMQKIHKNQEIIYTNYIKELKTDNYELNVNLPYVNIKNEQVQKLNQEIEKTFQEKSEEILKNEDTKIIYTVKYEAYIENNILSLIIYSELKQDLKAQRVIIQTFNYNFTENKQINLEDAIKINKLNKKEVQNKINTYIKNEQKKSDDLKELGYNVFSRDMESDKYKIENISEYFIYNNNIYIIFAYGNDSLTSEMDLVII